MRLIKGKKSLCRLIRDVAYAFVLLTTVLSEPLIAQEMLGRVEDNDVLYVAFDAPPPVGLIYVEIDGVRQPKPARIIGSSFLVDIPDDLTGTRHDLRLIVEGSRAGEDLGLWLFETPGNQSSAFGSVLSEIGVRTTGSETKGFAEGVIRLDFSRNDGQQSGRLVVSRNDRSGLAGQDEFVIGDVFLETRFPILGQDSFFRVGNADAGANTILQDDASRRGLTFGLVSPTGEGTLTAFAMTPDTQPKLGNFLGLSDKDNLVYGLSSSVSPVRNAGLKFDVEIHQGRSNTLPDSSTGDVTGRAMYLSVPIAAGRGDLSFGLASNNWQSDGVGASTSASAREVRAAWQLSAENAYQRNELFFSYEQIEQGFYSPFNPNLISGEERVGGRFESISPTWQWVLSYDVAETNYRGSTSAPTDRLSSVSFSLLHDPGDFTGGGLNGTKFFMNAGVDRQKRVFSPASSPTAQDNELMRLSFGMNKVEPNRFWGARLAFNDLDFDTSSASDERKLFAEGNFSVSPSPVFSGQFSTRVGVRETGGVRYNEAEASLTLIRSSIDRMWETSLEGNFLMSDDPAVDDGRSAKLSAARNIGYDSELVGEVMWGSGRYAPVGTTNEGVSIGLLFRTDFGFSKN